MITGIVIGLIIGGVTGMMCTCLCVASGKRGDNVYIRMYCLFWICSGDYSCVTGFIGEIYYGRIKRTSIICIAIGRRKF